MAQDYYKILGVDKKATQDEIKSQYRKLVKQYHPDLHPNDAQAAAKFKEINEANEVLSDPQKRAKYDYELENPFAAQGGGFSGEGGFDGGFDIFSQIFNQFTGGAGARSAKSAETKGVDLNIEVNLSFLDAAKGCTKEITFTRKEPCKDCKGTGAKGGTSYKTCDKCHGSGQVQFASGSGFFRTISTRVCPECSGRGKKIIDKCTTCGGKGYNRTNTTLKVDVPAGADNRSYIVKRGMGDASSNGGPAGDLYIIFNVQPHKILKRKNYDLYVDLPISYKCATMGGKIQVPWIDDTFTLEIPEGTQNGKTFTVRGKGLKSKFGSGNMYITVYIEIPTRLSRSQKQKLQSYDDEIDIKQNAKMLEYKNNVTALYGIDPYKS